MESIIPWNEWMKLIAPYYVQKERSRKLIPAPSSTKNATKSGDPEMHSTKKGNPWYFGMKIHSGADAGTGYVHTITATAANVHDIAKAHELVREDDHTVYGNSGYLGVEKRTEIRENPDLSGVAYRIAKRPSQNRMTKAYKGTNWDRKIEHAKASVLSKVEHPFLIVKRMFHASKTRYHGLRKNLLQYDLLFASANLVMCLRAGRQREFCMTTG